VLIARITSLRSVHPALEEAGADHEAMEKMPFLSALRLRLVRGALPPVLGVAVGLGSLFSLGIDFVRHNLNASDAEFGALIILFGVGAAAGMALLQIRRPRHPLKVLRPGVIVIGAVLAGMSLAPNLWAAFGGAVAFGAAASYAMVGGMTGIQKALSDDTERQLAFAAFHVGLRIALVLGALGAGAAGDLIKHTSFPGVGRLAPTRAVLFICGLLIMLAAWVFGGNIQTAIDEAEAGPAPAVPSEPQGPVRSDQSDQAAQSSSIRASSTRWSRIPLRMARSTRGPTSG
jgi:dTMP kinase